VNGLAPLIDGSRLVVLVGEGGVGKTSTAAALALAAAERGRRTAVLTVDPAPRLGDALGLGPIQGEARAVPLDASVAGSLEAMRLDAKGTFDRMVERFATDQAAAESLLANPVYRAVSGSLGGSEHYMAFQRLYELYETDDHDLLVVDTPPAANATDLLSAPARLSALLDAGALAILAEPARILARAGSALVRASFALILTVLERVAGDSLQREVAEFVRLFEQLLAGLEDRARAIDALLRAETTAFVLVARPSPDSVATTGAFARSLTRAGIHVDAMVVNRVTPPRPADRSVPRSERLRGAPPGILAAVTAMEHDMDALRLMESEALSRLRQGAAGTPILAVPALETDLGSLDDLRRIGARLMD
jgi:anion-transporting  ArsA/GET3 family ATPase